VLGYVLLCDGYVSFVNKKNAHDLFLHVRHIEMSWASDWLNHIDNRPNTWVVGNMRLIILASGVQY